ncbi:16S rRNA (cytidine(1402)-2'-O)-methyltransferase [Geoalkalibacter halelectricus]|uniref:Ribosomal RNA small subunit methyltransferase I n=1 Tax=Geoalkalibacter halelectricus TaxID=2847045 RepID=A0ABY5ZL25_9BACT|nr:16S rRNA (cytidine(1402)-2'-O)-methyltransferase [Geoalkalibacter halelectricus]MDO3378817.1 16S rRNA (cytidine(1402)-2'-O)-methyltransferase [Geoalkalibacter halelectricus]UWZ79877.1 16S rRNA (cytidine(1402)-2'-O)-methyltransferase [Geoalkalibacter halelectricus]
MAATLYIVATPIGNLEDISLRALRILKEVALIAAEDTRHSRKLLSHYGIATSLVAYHEHNEEARGAQLLNRLEAGQSVALISDAGTPAISDPGFHLVRRCRAAGVSVVAVPGPSALTAALSVAGLPCHRFAFEGFVPPRKKAREDLFTALRDEARTLVFYEAPHRLRASLEAVVGIFGTHRQVAVARELTKKHEELFSGSATEVSAHFAQGEVRGEIVLLIAPAEKGAAPREDVPTALERLGAEQDLPPAELVRRVAKATGEPRSQVYQEYLRWKEKRL